MKNEHSSGSPSNSEVTQPCTASDGNLTQQQTPQGAIRGQAKPTSIKITLPLVDPTAGNSLSYNIPFSSPMSTPGGTRIKSHAIDTKTEPTSNTDLEITASEDSIQRTVDTIYAKESLQSNQIPYIPITTLSFLNDPAKLGIHLTAPFYQILRYSLFLDIAAHHLRNDPVNFANIRLQSIINFLVRHKSSNAIKSQSDPPRANIRIYEGILASELMQCRTFVRKLITLGYERDRTTMNLESFHGSSTLFLDIDYSDDEISSLKVQNFVQQEELIQLNFTNLIRYIINLPVDAPTTTAEEAMLYNQLKHLFNKINDIIYDLRKDEYGSTESGNVDTDKEFTLVQAITKVSYDFILLEMYLIHILTKFNNNSIIEEFVSKELFEVYQKGVVPKVLFFNQQFSSQYSWYFAITFPFIRLFELSIYNEKYFDECAWNEAQSTSNELASYYNLVSFKNFAEYNKKTTKEIVDMIRSLTSSNVHKPLNFLHYSSNLLLIPDDSLNLVQSRDLLYQLNFTNYKFVLGQFHRILVKGGFLEIPITILNSGNKPNNFLGVDFLEYFDIIPDFVTVILRELAQLFGKESVKQSIVILNPKNEVSQYIISHLGLHLFEKIGKLNEYCEYFNNDEIHEHTAKFGKDVHYYIHLRARKL